MKKGIQAALSGAVLVFISAQLQAAELNMVPRHGMNGDLRDGTKIATGRITCREAHTGFMVWMNARQSESTPGHYIIQGRRDDRHELRVRIGGEGWSESVTEGREGVVTHRPDEQAVFDVLADGDQHVSPDEYVYSVAGACL